MAEGVNGLGGDLRNNSLAYRYGHGGRTRTCRAAVLGGLAVVAALLTTSARATPSQYFDVNSDSPDYGIVDGGSYSWDDPNWAVVTGGNDPTGPWTAGNFARFQGGQAGNSYTVTVNNDESMAGLYETVSGVSLTINATGAGTLDVVAGNPIIYQGFLMNGSSVIINAPITGFGGIAPQLNGSLYLYGNNSYTGGTAFGFSGSPQVYFNNSNSFGFPGSIISNIFSTPGHYSTLIATGGSPITLSDNFETASPGNGFNFASAPNTPLTITGGMYSQGGGSLVISNNSPSSSPLTLEGQIGSLDVILRGGNDATFIYQAMGAFNTMTVGAPGASNFVLKLNGQAVFDNPSLIMAGATLDPGGMDQPMSFTTLGVTANSTIDFGAGASEVDFGPSSGENWTGTLNLLNWDPLIDRLRIGFDQTGLTPDQLALIEFNGTGLGSATIDSDGYIVATPEPSSMFLLMGASLLGAPMLGLRRRRLL